MTIYDVVIMRTIIDLTEEQITALDRLRKQSHTSRAALIREAVEVYLATRSTKSLKDRPGFGAWKHKQLDGVKYQRRLRAEWEPRS
jgi:metal-responsive CopG/Arc/MetJ family transcriptional regulator